MITNFNYELAFSRNLGFLSRAEQNEISKKTIAIPGMGGVGGHHMHSLARLGFRRFKIADFDTFEQHNFNRQIGARISTLGQNKAEAMKRMILDIIPDAEIEVFTNGVSSDNYTSFLNGVDVVVDGLDLYVIKPRIELYDLAYDKNIPVVTAGPLGMGTSLLTFMPGQMKFSTYFDITTAMTESELLAKFLAGICPTFYYIRYLLYKEELDVKSGRVSSLHVGCLAATTALAAEVTKIVLGRGAITCAPDSIQWDFYLNKHKKNWRPFGNRNPLQRLMIFIIKRKMAQLSKSK